MSETVSDAQLQTVLGRFVALAEVIVRDPAAWLGDDLPGDPAQDADGGRGLGRRVLAGLGAAAGRARRLAAGRVHPGSPGWAALPVEERSDWWVRRVQAVAAPVAATPRIAGALADRVPLQGALGSAAAGLVVCAVAREHGVDAPHDWVPLLARVLFERDLSAPASVPSAEEAQAQADAQEAGAGDAPSAAVPGPLRRAAGGLWRLTLLLWSLPGLFDERPRGALVWRALGKLPVVGLPAGLLDERGAVRAAADESRRLLGERASRPA